MTDGNFLLVFFPLLFQHDFGYYYRGGKDYQSRADEYRAVHKEFLRQHVYYFVRTRTEYPVIFSREKYFMENDERFVKSVAASPPIMSGIIIAAIAA